MKPWFASSLLRALWGRLRTPALIGASLLLAACALSRPAPVKQMFLLEPEPPAAVATAKTTSLRVGTMTVGAPFRGRALVYRQGELRYEHDFYSEFFVTPSSMLAQDVARALTAAKVFQRIVPPGATPDDADYILDGFATELYADLRENGKPAAVIAITFYLSNAAGNVIWSKEYSQRVAATDSSPDAIVHAWNGALTAILAELTRDLAAIPLSSTALPASKP